MLVPATAVGAVGVPTRAGLLANTSEPVPVSSLTAAASCAEVATSVLLVRLNVLLVTVCEVSRSTKVLVAAPVPMVRRSPAVLHCSTPSVVEPVPAGTTRVVGLYEPPTRTGLFSVGASENTRCPVPVSSEMAAASCAEVEIVVRPVAVPLIATSLLAFPVNPGSLSKPAAIRSNSARIDCDVAAEPVTGKVLWL